MMNGQKARIIGKRLFLKFRQDKNSLHVGGNGQGNEKQLNM